MPSDAGDDAPVSGSMAEVKVPAHEAASANAPFLPGDEDMHISPHPVKRPRPEPRSPNYKLDYNEPEAKRPRHDSALADRRSRSPRPKSPRRDKLYRERSHSGLQDRSRSYSRNSRSHSRTRFDRYSKSPEARRDRRDSVREREDGRRDGRDSTPPYQRRRSSGGRGAGVLQTSPHDVRRKASISKEERKRGQRLFGGLFSGLGQPLARGRTGPGAGGTKGERGTVGTELRRPGVNVDRQPERPQQTEEERQKQADRLAKLERIRKIEQVKLDEKKMHTMHANELVLARGLHTRSKPVLYYRPRNLTEAQEQVIEKQVCSARRRIEEETSQFEEEKQKRLAALDVRYAPKITASESKQPDSAPEDIKTGNPAESTGKDLDMDMAPLLPQEEADAMANKPDGNVQAEEAKLPAFSSAKNRAGHDFHEDKDRGIMVETEEDTVIY
ncbi:hypothetical protein SBRCBS47491_000036 [Sporothrix bragantina]|uniref:Pinin/SDK/MemA protein domain-containing protein n=1 Tax=Sporothrix bragantina TaxID=671064 RepID=A0ABP0AKA3_9PEZI